MNKEKLLPENWFETKLEEISNPVSTSGKKIKTKDALPFGKYPVIDQGISPISGYVNDPSLLVPASIDKPIIIFGDHTRIVKYVTKDFVPGADGTKLIRAKNEIDSKYLKYLIQQADIPDRGYSRHYQFLKSVNLPLAPKNEQRRIADKLDTVLTRVDAVQNRLARITPLLKRFRQSVLAAATSGRLTEDWRQNKDISTFSWKAITEFREQILPDLPNSWKWVEFSEVASVQSDLRDPSEYQNEIHLAPNHIEPWSGKISGCQTIADDAVKSPKHWFNAGQIVYSKIRPNLCKVAIPNFSGLCSADMYPISTKLNDSYLLLWMLGERFTIWASNAESRTVLPKINTKELGKIPVPVTSAEEQTEIVRRVETLFAFADRLEARLQSAQTAAERLTPALLAKAFRGELVPQDPNDEPATELLRRLREARVAQTPPKPKRGRKAAATESALQNSKTRTSIGLALFPS